MTDTEEILENLKVVKRNGRKLVDFDGTKVAIAIKKDIAIHRRIGCRQNARLQILKHQHADKTSHDQSVENKRRPKQHAKQNDKKDNGVTSPRTNNS